jgi:hypothetical protein
MNNGMTAYPFWLQFEPLSVFIRNELIAFIFNVNEMNDDEIPCFEGIPLGINVMVKSE